MNSWPAEVTRALQRSKFGRDESRQYELVIYKPIQAVLQQGPQCGLVALAMAMNLRSCPVTAEQLFNKAKELSLTIQGELFDARVIPQLCQYFDQTATLHQWTNVNDLFDCLRSDRLCLVPYDADANHEPCLKQGHRAHWLLVHGYLKDSSSDQYDLVLVQHGKSVHLAAFSLLDLFHSNGQLIEIDEKRRSLEEYVYPSDGSLHKSLCHLFIGM